MPFLVADASSPADDEPDRRAEQVRHAYVCGGESVRRIAADTGLGQRRVTRLLRTDGVQIANRGAGRARPGSRARDPRDLSRLLRELYVEQRLSSPQIAALLAIPDRRVRTRLAEYGIRRRTRGQHNREDRRSIDPATLIDLALHLDLPVAAISERLGVSYPSALRTAHDLGVPVRLGGPRRKSGPQDIELIHALYADHQVRRVLRAHEVPVVPPGRPLWERFPVPVSLTGRLVEELYSDCGLSALHIEMLTGQPITTVWRALAHQGVPRRPPSVRSPFWRRWRLTHPS